MLKRLIGKEGSRAEPSTIQLAVSSKSQRRRSDYFGTAGEVAQILDRAKVKLAGLGHVAASTRRRRDKALLEAAAAEEAKNAGNGSPSPLPSMSSEPLWRRAAPASTSPTALGVPVPTWEECRFDPYFLLDGDFIDEPTSAEKAREAFNDLGNVGRILDFLQELEDTLTQAEAEDKSAADILDDAHMIFTGPPGTGKTTVAQRSASCFGIWSCCLGLR